VHRQIVLRRLIAGIEIQDVAQDPLCGFPIRTFLQEGVAEHNP
jgi:hypothetical protein